MGDRYPEDAPAETEQGERLHDHPEVGAGAIGAEKTGEKRLPDLDVKDRRRIGMREDGPEDVVGRCSILGYQMFHCRILGATQVGSAAQLWMSMDE